MTRLDREDILGILDGQPHLFPSALKRRVLETEGLGGPLSFHIAMPADGGIDLSQIPEFRAWLGKILLDMSVMGARAFLDVFIELKSQMIGMEDDHTDLLQQNRNLLAENKELRLEIRRLQGEETTPLDWKPFDWDDHSLPWSRSPE